nr:MAG TPA: hypothetical protein [Caudoviricetes sp.]
MKAIQHDSDCAVHNEPAIPAGPCDCGAQAKHERRFATWLCQLGCKTALRLRNRLASPLWRLSSTAKTSASRALCRFCLYLLFGSRVVRACLQSSPQAGKVLRHGDARRR